MKEPATRAPSGPQGHLIEGACPPRLSVARDRWRSCSEYRCAVDKQLPCENKTKTGVQRGWKTGRDHGGRVVRHGGCGRELEAPVPVSGSEICVQGPHSHLAPKDPGAQGEVGFPLANELGVFW